MTHDGDEPDWNIIEYGVDVNGCPTELVEMDGQPVHIHYDDLPDSDVTTLRGMPITTPLRTVIDIAADLGAAELDHVVRNCLDRRLFTVEQAIRRLDQPDMASRRGAHVLRQHLRHR